MSIAPYIRLTSLTSSAYAPEWRDPHWLRPRWTARARNAHPQENA